MPLPPSPHYTSDHQEFAAAVRAFVQREVTPHVQAWEDACEFPRDLYAKAGQLGLLGLGMPEQLGGTPGDPFFTIAATYEIAQAGSGGVMAGLQSCHIALPPILALGSPELQHRIIPGVLRGGGYL